jgi:glycosyltransferase involved in cell wall biosynthesis
MAKSAVAIHFSAPYDQATVILFAILCYRCEKQVGRVIRAFGPELLAQLGKVVVIDNRSPDSTLQAAREAIESSADPAKFELVQNNANYGLGGSHKVAFRYAETFGASWVGILHGDDQASVPDVERLIIAARDHSQADAILGARFMKGASLRGYSRLRTAGNRVLNLVYGALTFRRTYDMGSGLNLFSVSSLRDHRYMALTDGFTFNMELLLHYREKKANLVFVPITWTETDQVSNAKTLSVGWKALTALARWRWQGSPAAPPKETKTDYGFEKR